MRTDFKFDRYTDRANKVMLLARQFAKQVNSSVVGTEHLLYGLVQEGTGVAGFVLREAGLTLKAIIRHLNVQVCDKFDKSCQQYGLHSLPKAALTPCLMEVLSNAVKEAETLGHKYVGTEHLLLGLLTLDIDYAFVGQNILKELNIDKKMLIEEVLGLLGGEPRSEKNLPEKDHQENIPPKEVPNGVKWAIKLYLNNFDGKFYDMIAQYFSEYGFSTPRMTSPSGIHSKLEVVFIGDEKITPVECVLLVQRLFATEPKVRACGCIKEMRLLRITDDVDLMPATKI